jgi:2-phosphoglycerate kinase
VGKSTIATQIAQRLNLPNVLQVHQSPIISSCQEP